jgi:ATP-dependent Clp protease adapter protein ClpS
MPGWFGRFWRGLFGGSVQPGVALDPDLEVVLHVARHLAGTGALSTHGLMQGLLQDERFVAAIERVGGDAAAVAERITFDGTGDEARWRPPSDEETAIRHQIGGGDAELALARACGIAYHRARPATCTDLWAYLLRTNVGVELERAGVDPIAVMFVMAHGVPEQDLARTTSAVVHVVLRNDDYTRSELVFRVLREVFELGEPGAVQTIQATEGQGRAIIGRFDLAAARQRVVAGRALARTHGYPLWLGIEDC